MPKQSFTINHDIRVGDKILKAGTEFKLDEANAEDAAQLAMLRASGRLVVGEMVNEPAPKAEAPAEPAKESPKSKTKDK